MPGVELVMGYQNMLGDLEEGCRDLHDCGLCKDWTRNWGFLEELIWNLIDGSSKKIILRMNQASMI